MEHCISRVARYVLAAPTTEPQYDVGVLQLTDCPSEWGGKYPYLELADSLEVREGDDVAISGYPLKWDLSDSRLPNLSKGIVSHIDERLGEARKWNMAGLVLDINANPGNSGGPVFEPESGRVLGMVVSQRLTEPPGVSEELKGKLRIPAGIVYCIPSGLIKTAVEAFKYGESLPP
jgi:serine protease Do